MMPTTSPRSPQRLGFVALALVTSLGGVAAIAISPSASAGTTRSEYGSLSAADATLPADNRCGTYSYAYDLRPPPGEWALETTVVDPRGNAVTSYTAADHYSPGGTSSSTSYTLCRNSTAPGLFTLTGKLTVDDGLGNVSTHMMAPATFELSTAPAPVRHARHKHRHHRRAGTTKSR